ncbi:hypothetical protein HS7_08930 [Sulfolobales archaeon HS-7]|nr:hypothetical protein HS7_08930 [Sulfolobales archaeon HS-7]
MKRYPAVAGSFYSNNPTELKKQIESAFLHPLGPGSLPRVKRAKPNTSVFVVPHAGYIYSGPIASHVFYEMAELGTPDAIIILGPDHNGVGKIADVFSEGEWVTPLGELRVEKRVAVEVVRNSEIVDINEKAHLYEHSIEVQLPFIYYLYNSQIPIVPIQITLQEPETSEKVAKGIVDTINLIGISAMILASSDMVHYEPHDMVIKKDNEAIAEILKLDHIGLYDTVERKNITMCGYGPVMTALVIGKKLGLKARMLSHATSGDTSGNKSSVVGYLSVIIN